MSVIQVALPLYQKFKEQCPNFKTDELPTKTGWCVYAEKYSKCNQPAKYEGDGGEMRAIVDKNLRNLIVQIYYKLKLLIVHPTHVGDLQNQPVYKMEFCF